MCGIAGIFDRSGADHRPALQLMLEAMSFRGPDGQGIWSEGPVTLGHRRLAIVDLSDAGRQPMPSPSGRFMLSFNGEILNFRELIDEWGIDRDALRSSSDTELLAIGWERYGEALLDRLVGPFACAVYDRRESRLTLVRDRLGERPLFLAQRDERFAFASTLRALLRLEWVDRSLAPLALEEFLTLRYTLAPRTLFGGIRKLEPGSLVRIDAGGVHRSRWWEPRFGSEFDRPVDGRQAVEQFDALFRRAVSRCLISDRPVGLLLSDGIDSNSINAVLEEERRETPKFFFAVGRNKSAREKEQALGSERVIRATPEQRLQSIVDYFSRASEPVGDGAAVATWEMLRVARQDATVFLCGHGGDEVMGGYRLSQERFRLAALKAFGPLRLAIWRGVIERYCYGAESVEQRARRLGAARFRELPAAARHWIHRPLPLADLIELCGDRTVASRYLSEVDALYAECDARLADAERMQRVLLRGFFCDDILSYADSAAMSHSLEARLPFADRDLVQFVLALPWRERFGAVAGHRNTKLLLRRWARAHVAPEVLQRKKRSFAYGSVRNLLQAKRQELRAMLLDSVALRSTLPGLEAWFDRPVEYFHGPREGTLWSLLAFAGWERGLSA